MNAYPGMEDAWKKCKRCGRYYEIGTTRSQENCLAIAQAIANDLRLRDYKYLVVSGYRAADYTTYGCCGKACKKGTRVAWRPDSGGSHLYHYDLLVERNGWGGSSYSVYRANYNQGQGSYSYTELRFGSWDALEDWYRRQYADVEGLSIGMAG